MAATIIDGKAVAAGVRARVAAGVERFLAEHGRPPGLATVLVGEDPASAVYVGGKQRACAEVGMRPLDVRLPVDARAEQVADTLAELGADQAVDGILLQLPVPAHLDGPSLTELIDPAKDVDGLTPVNAGLLALGRPGLRPCTPSGVMELLASVGASLEGAEAVVVGRSNLFGKPMAQLLLQANATVTVCHSRTRDLAAVCARADVLIVAAGRPRMVGREHVKPGAIVIDVGINRLSPGAAAGAHSPEGWVGGQADRLGLGGTPNRPTSGLVGDVDFEAAAQVASAITPVPGGVGPMTIAMLLENTLRAARARAELGSLAR